MERTIDEFKVFLDKVWQNPPTDIDPKIGEIDVRYGEDENGAWESYMLGLGIFTGRGGFRKYLEMEGPVFKLTVNGVDKSDDIEGFVKHILE